MGYFYLFENDQQESTHLRDGGVELRLDQRRRRAELVHRLGSGAERVGLRCSRIPKLRLAR